MSFNQEENEEFDMIMTTMLDVVNTITTNILRNSSYYENIYNRINIIFDDDEELERALIESLEIQPTLDKKEDVKVDLPSENYDSITMKENNNCCICLSNYNKKSIVVKLENCKHIIHKKCLEEWISYKNECPICRKKIDIDTYLKK
jgi:hypothetical protein